MRCASGLGHILRGISLCFVAGHVGFWFALHVGPLVHSMRAPCAGSNGRASRDRGRLACRLRLGVLCARLSMCMLSVGEALIILTVACSQRHAVLMGVVLGV